MKTKIWQLKKLALLTAALAGSTLSTAWASAPPLYQMHSNGSIWQYTGTPCQGNVCGGWQELDNNSQAIQIAAGEGRFFELHADESIWQFTGKPCTVSGCPGWVMIGQPYWERPSNMAGTQIISAANGVLVQEQFDGSLWQFTGQVCSGSVCPGWLKLDDNFDYDNYVVGAAGLLEQHVDGSIWLSTGAPCAGNFCPGWKQIDGNPETVNVQCSRQIMNCSMASGTLWAYQLWQNGAIWQFTGQPCGANGCPGWRLVDNSPNTTQITAGSSLYQMQSNGSIWQFPGTPCNGNSCVPWWQLDDNSATSWIVAGPNTVYQVHNDGSLWQYTGPICNGSACTGWVEIDNNPETYLVVPSF